jgi:hypothetical protein
MLCIKLFILLITGYFTVVALALHFQKNDEGNVYQIIVRFSEKEARQFRPITFDMHLKMLSDPKKVFDFRNL